MTTASAAIISATGRSFIRRSSKNLTGSSANASRKAGVNSGKCFRFRPWLATKSSHRASGHRTPQPCHAFGHPSASGALAAPLLQAREALRPWHATRRQESTPKAGNLILLPVRCPIPVPSVLRGPVVRPDKGTRRREDTRKSGTESRIVLDAVFTIGLVGRKNGGKFIGGERPAPGPGSES